jgi:hypothetical protein
MFHSMMNKYLTAALVTCALIKTGFAPPAAADIPSDHIESHHAPSLLPYCINSSSDLAQIKDTQKANAKTSSKYDVYRKILHGTADLELATRLAYAETLAANCPGEQDRVMDLVASVIGNRVRVRHGDVRSVVLQRDQFASSLNIYPESRYRDFMCPTDSELWNKTLAKMRTNIESSKSSASLPGDALHYYLYRHSDRFEAPDWKLDEATTTDEELRKCIRVFRNPSWK